MARAKTASDERYNARRRARRELSRIERQLNSISALDPQYKTLTGYADRLRSSIAGSYVQPKIQRGMTVQERRKLTKSADQSIKRSVSVLTAREQSRNASERNNRIFAERLKQAASGKRTGLSGLDRISTQFFYQATRRLWQGMPRERRNELIMKGLGVSSLEEAYRNVMRANRAQIREWRETLGEMTEHYTFEGWTDQQINFYAEEPSVLEGDRLTSPINLVEFF